MKRIAIKHDLVAWKSFMEGEVSFELPKLQSPLLAWYPSKLSAGDWFKKLINGILHISYGQWIFCNTSLHDAVSTAPTTKISLAGN